MNYAEKKAADYSQWIKTEYARVIARELTKVQQAAVSTVEIRGRKFVNAVTQTSQMSDEQKKSREQERAYLAQRVATHFGCTVEAIRSISQRVVVVRARNVLAFLCNRELDMSHREFGEWVGRCRESICRSANIASRELQKDIQAIMEAKP